MGHSAGVRSDFEDSSRAESAFGMIVPAAFDTGMVTRDWLVVNDSTVDTKPASRLLAIWRDENLPKFAAAYGLAAFAIAACEDALESWACPSSEPPKLKRTQASSAREGNYWTRRCRLSGGPAAQSPMKCHRVLEREMRRHQGGACPRTDAPADALKHPRAPRAAGPANRRSLRP